MKKNFLLSKSLLLIVFCFIYCLNYSIDLNAQTYDIVVAKDGSGNYSTVQAAIDAVPDNQTSWYTIYIKNGEYYEKINISSSKTYIHMIGESRDGVQLTYDDNSDGQVSNSVTNEAGNFIAENISFINSFDYDNYDGEGAQATAYQARGDKQAFGNCKFIGHQDTLFVHSGRQYFLNCYVEGVVDFIYGGSTAVFDNCTINCCYRDGGGGVITAPSTEGTIAYGIIFLNCEVTADSGVNTDGFSLGRPWHASGSTTINSSCAYLNCYLADAVGCWTDMSGFSWEDDRFYEYNNSGPGADTSRPQLSDSEAANYTVSNILSGSDGWNPQDEISITPTPTPLVDQIEYQAEDAFISEGVVETEHSGYTGAGYVNLENNNTSYIEFSVNSGSTEEKSVTFRYANGSGSDRPMEISVNGNVVNSSVSFPDTVEWTSWNTVSINLDLNSGINTIRAKSTVENGGPNIDKIDMVQVTTTPTPGTICGDVNSSEQVDIVDALLIAQYYVGVNPANFNQGVADVNGDGSVNIIDALLVAQYYVGIITTLSCS